MGGGGIFTGNINLLCTSNMMIAMVLFACFFEFCCAQLEHVLHGNKGHMEMLTKFYKELMILGFIAFSVEVSGEFGVRMSPENKHCFHFADVLLSCCVLCYLLKCAWASFAMHLIRRDWDRISMKSVERVLVSLDENLELHKSAWGKFKSNFPWTRLYSMRDEADFKTVQLIFKTQFHLKHNFDYVMYAKCVLEDLVVDLSNIEVPHWIGICLFCVATNVGQQLAADNDAATWAMSDLIISEEEQLAYESQEPNGGARRRLGGSAAPLDMWLGCSGLDCGLDELEFTQGVERLKNTTFNNYTSSCSVCYAEASAPKPDATSAQLAFAMAVYFCIGATLLTAHTLINASLGVRMNRMLRLAGAKDPYKLRDLLVTLQADLDAYQRDVAAAEAEALAGGGGGGKAIEIFEEEADDEQVTDDATYGDEDDNHTIHFTAPDGKKKDSGDVLTLVAFRRIMFWTKFVCLMNCFYIGFYVVHMSYKVSRVEWTFLPGDFPILSNFFIHMVLIAPTVPMIVSLLPVTIRRMALLWGVLYLSDNAVNDVYLHMELITSVRSRIMRRLMGSKFLKGKPKPQEGAKLLKVIENGELVMLSQLVERKASDRLTRTEIWQMMDAQHTHTTDKQLKDFMNRSAFEAYLKESPADQATAQTAKTLVLDPRNKKGDTITVEECTLFILRAVADVLNVAAEHGTDQNLINKVRDAITDLDHISPENYQAALTIARVKSLFHSVDVDRSQTLSRRELWKAIRKYQIAVTPDELDIIIRVMDPDQSGTVTLEEWFDFMLSSEDDLEAITLSADHSANVINAGKKVVDELGGAVKSVATGTVGVVASGLDSTVGAVPGVGKVTDTVGLTGNDSILRGKGVISRLTSPDSVSNPVAESSARSDQAIGMVEPAAPPAAPPRTFESEPGDLT